MQKILDAGGGVRIGATVLYNDSNAGWIPAMVVHIFPPTEEQKKSRKGPNLSLTVFIAGYHQCMFARDSVGYGKEVGEWLCFDDVEDLQAEPNGELSAPARKQLDALKELEQLSKPAPEPESKEEEKANPPAEEKPEAPPEPAAPPPAEKPAPKEKPATKPKAE